jgi:hypothetical protein
MLLGVVVACLAPSNTLACSCSEIPIEEEFASSSAVFSCVVTGVEVVQETCENDVEVTVNVMDCWKGDVEGVTRVYTAIAGDCCGLSFTEGEEYLIFATDFYGPEPWTGLCSRTQPIASAGEELDWLGESGCGVSPAALVSWTAVKDVYR